MPVGGRKRQAEGTHEAERILPRQVRIDVKRIDKDERRLVMQSQIMPEHWFCVWNNDRARKPQHRLVALRAM